MAAAFLVFLIMGSILVMAYGVICVLAGSNTDSPVEGQKAATEGLALFVLGAFVLLFSVASAIWG